MTKKELIESGVKIYLKPLSFHWVKTLPKNAVKAENLYPFRTLANDKTYKVKLNEIYFVKSYRIDGYWLSSIKSYTDFEKLHDYITLGLVYS